jgi:hypothetical protein
MATLINPLFPNFLSDYNVYQQAEQYWSEAVTQLLQPHGLSHHPFYTKHFGNGQPIADGNPIFNGYIPGRHKLVRILQYDPTTFEGASIGYYTDTWPTPEMDPDKRPHPTDPALRDAPIPELVISLYLTEETAAQARHLLHQWLVEDKEVEEG